MRFLAVMLLLSACAKGKERARPRDCEAVLAHLVVLERGAADQTMCKYHAACDGEKADRYAKYCPRVLERTEAKCYLRATSADEADECLHRDAFDDAIRKGRRGRGGGGGGGDDSPWIGGGASTPLGEMRVIANDACACKDKTCADEVQERFEEWARRNASSTMSTDPVLSKQMTDLAMKASECMMKVIAGDSYGNYYGAYDAGVPDANTYYKDPFNFTGGGGGTGMPACDEYLTTLEKAAKCSSYPAYSTQSKRELFDQMRRDWGDVSAMSSYAKEAANEACRSLVDSTKSDLSYYGCP